MLFYESEKLKYQFTHTLTVRIIPYINSKELKIVVQLNLTSGTYLSPDKVKTEEQIVFMDEGEIVPSNFDEKKNVFQITIQVVGREKEGDYTWSMNKTTQKAIAKEYGKDTKEWIGKMADIEVLQQNVRGTVRDVVYAKPVA